MHKIFIVCSMIIAAMSLFCGFAGIGTFSEDIGVTPDEPDVWSVGTWVAEGLWSLLSFSVESVPTFLTLIFWLVIMTWTWCIIGMIRGVN